MPPPLDTATAPPRLSIVLQHPIGRLAAIGAVFALVWLPWLAMPWKLPVVGLVGVALVWLETRSSAAAGVKRHGLFETVAWAVFLVGILSLIEPLLQALIESITGTQTDYSAYGALRGNLDAVIQLIGIAWLSAAVGEELIFRAFLMHQLDALLSRLPMGQLIAALLNGAVFGAMHAVQGVSGMVFTGIAGAVFAYAYLRSNRNLLAMILAHGLLDTWGLTTLYLGWY